MRKIQTGRQESHACACASRSSSGRERAGANRAVSHSLEKGQRVDATFLSHLSSKGSLCLSLSLSLWRARALPGAAERSLSSSPGQPGVPMRFAPLPSRSARGLWGPYARRSKAVFLLLPLFAPEHRPSVSPARFRYEKVFSNSQSRNPVVEGIPLSRLGNLEEGAVVLFDGSWLAR